MHGRKLHVRRWVRPWISGMENRRCEDVSPKTLLTHLQCKFSIHSFWATVGTSVVGCTFSADRLFFKHFPTFFHSLMLVRLQDCISRLWLLEIHNSIHFYTIYLFWIHYTRGWSHAPKIYSPALGGETSSDAPSCEIWANSDTGRDVWWFGKLRFYPGGQNSIAIYRYKKIYIYIHLNCYCIICRPSHIYEYICIKIAMYNHHHVSL